jgi:hypothetical protein
MPAFAKVKLGHSLASKSRPSHRERYQSKVFYKSFGLVTTVSLFDRLSLCLVNEKDLAGAACPI